MAAVLDLFAASGPVAGPEDRVIAAAGARLRHDGACFVPGPLLLRALGAAAPNGPEALLLEALPDLCARILGAGSGNPPEVLRVHLRCRDDRAEPWRGPGPAAGLCAVTLLTRDNLILEEASVYGAGPRHVGTFALAAGFDCLFLDRGRTRLNGISFIRPDPARPGRADLALLAFRAVAGARLFDAAE